ncbi:Transposon Ty3-I Gag-Pol polyprotein [Gossypium australe]|uniref:Transposon Ty3-I Gag-Pol polyprotein n=1 Tax=Gossypium australe TaxID=47621 RepID=A0A5B6VWU9_9ROSI|nr:Transposon Ty3-I Gag-Pol polyprotein [Gossypium australe]
MTGKGIVLVHKFSRQGIEVDKEKNMSVKGIRSFLGHAGFYKRFIKDFSKISKLFCKLLEKDLVFIFDDDCLTAFEKLKKRLVSAPIIINPDCSSPFELCKKVTIYTDQATIKYVMSKRDAKR